MAMENLLTITGNMKVILELRDAELRSGGESGMELRNESLIHQTLGVGMMQMGEFGSLRIGFTTHREAPLQWIKELSKRYRQTLLELKYINFDEYHCGVAIYRQNKKLFHRECTIPPESTEGRDFMAENFPTQYHWLIEDEEYEKSGHTENLRCTYITEWQDNTLRCYRFREGIDEAAQRRFYEQRGKTFYPSR